METADTEEAENARENAPVAPPRSPPDSAPVPKKRMKFVEEKIEEAVDAIESTGIGIFDNESNAPISNEKRIFKIKRQFSVCLYMQRKAQFQNFGIRCISFTICFKNVLKIRPKKGLKHVFSPMTSKRGTF